MSYRGFNSLIKTAALVFLILAVTPGLVAGPNDAQESCCEGQVGDCNMFGGLEPTIGDISFMLRLMFWPGPWEEPMCLEECDVNQSGGCNLTLDDITIGDISILIEYMFIKGPYDPVTNPSGTILPDCLGCE